MKAYKMIDALVTTFVVTSGFVFLITGSAKLYSAFGHIRLLQTDVPLLNISYRNLMIILGMLELGISVLCFFAKNRILPLVIVFWISNNFLLYRITVLWTGYPKPCSCLGNLMDALHIPSQAADTAMKIVLAYLLIGSYGILFLQWWKRRTGSGMQNDGGKPAAGSLATGIGS